MEIFGYVTLSALDLEDLVGLGMVFGLLAFAWYIITFIQVFLGYGTAYRLTKKGGDNGVALFGWLLVMGWAAIVPGLGFYLWKKYKNVVPPYNPYGGQPYGTQPYGAPQPQPYTPPAEPLPFGIQPQPPANPPAGQPYSSNPYESNPYDGSSNNNPPV